MSRRLPSIITSVYFLLVLLSIIPIFSGEGPLGGVFAVLLTQPWISLLDRLFGSSGNLVTGLILIIVGAAINGAILYYLLRWLVGRFSS